MYIYIYIRSYTLFAIFSRSIVREGVEVIQTSTTETESWASEATRRGSGSGSRASVVTVDVATSGVEGYNSHGWSYQVSGTLGRSDEGGGTSGCTHGGEWAGGGSYEASWAGTWSTYVLGTFLGSNAVGWSALGSNVSLGSFGRSNVSPASDHSCSTERKVSRHRPNQRPSLSLFFYGSLFTHHQRQSVEHQQLQPPPRIQRRSWHQERRIPSWRHPLGGISRCRHQLPDHQRDWHLRRPGQLLRGQRLRNRHDLRPERSQVHARFRRAPSPLPDRRTQPADRVVTGQSHRCRYVAGRRWLVKGQ